MYFSYTIEFLLYLPQVPWNQKTVQVRYEPANETGPHGGCIGILWQTHLIGDFFQVRGELPAEEEQRDSTGDKV